MLIYIYISSFDILLGNLTTLFALLRSNENEEKLRNMHLHSGFFFWWQHKKKHLKLQSFILQQVWKDLQSNACCLRGPGWSMNQTWFMRSKFTQGFSMYSNYYQHWKDAKGLTWNLKKGKQKNVTVFWCKKNLEFLSQSIIV